MTACVACARRFSLSAASPVMRPIWSLWWTKWSLVEGDDNDRRPLRSHKTSDEGKSPLHRSLCSDDFIESLSGECQTLAPQPPLVRRIPSASSKREQILAILLTGDRPQVLYPAYDVSNDGLCSPNRQHEPSRSPFMIKLLCRHRYEAGELVVQALSWLASGARDPANMPNKCQYAERAPSHDG